MRSFIITLITLLSLVSLCARAQQKPPQRILAKSTGVMVPCPVAEYDKKTKKETVTWHSTNNAWIKDFCWVKNVQVEEDFDNIFPELSGNQSLFWNDAMVPMSWMLTEENDETVLHCYFRMPADEVTNLWLASEEACLVDNETGVQYRIRRTEPDTFRKHFGVRAKKGSVIDLKVVFPPLPETTSQITIFGIPNWYLVGNTVAIRNNFYGKARALAYDQQPQYHQPRLLQQHLSEEKPYNRQNWNTWQVYTDAHLIKPVKDQTMAVWLTPEATYLALAAEQNWSKEYFGFESRTVLVGPTGHQYRLREVQGLPLDQLFFMDGNAGDYISFMMVFEPLPVDISTFSYIAPEGEPFSAWGANWSGTVLLNLSIDALRSNQPLFDYRSRVVVK